jgi:hypothetical protein
MPTSVAFGIALAFVGFLALDHYVLHLDAALFFAREAAALVNWVAFWR